MFAAAWIAIHLILGLPLAVAIIVVGREVVRALVALAAGFRIFEIRWGVGGLLGRAAIGPLDLAVAVWPIGGSTTAASGSPRHHRSARLAIAASPALLQLAFAFWRATNPASLSLELRSGFAPMATLEIANLGLLALHGLIPFEVGTGFRSDIRAVLDIVFGRAETHRHARARYYARFARMWLERGQVERANQVLEQGLTQLGRNTLLVDCEARMLAEDLSSVVDQGRCADALGLLIEATARNPHPHQYAGRARVRLREGLITALPLLLAGAAFSTLRADTLVGFAHQRLIHASRTIVDDGSPDRCERQLARWRRWGPALDFLGQSGPVENRDRHRQIGRLENCHGDLEAAARHQAVAVSAAEEARVELLARVESDPGTWLTNEIELAVAFRDVADLARRRNRFQLALATLRLAENQLDRAIRTGEHRPPPDERLRIGVALAAQRDALGNTRSQVLAQMSVH